MVVTMLAKYLAYADAHPWAAQGNHPPLNSQPGRMMESAKPALTMFVATV